MGLIGTVKQGITIGKTPLGYKRDLTNKAPKLRKCLIIDEETAPTIRKIFNLYIQGYSYYGIANKLIEESSTLRKWKDKDYYDYLIIKEVFDESKGTYGYRRITEGVKIKYGVIFNHKKVARIMKKYYIKPEYIKRIKTKSITYKRIETNVRPNLVKRKFTTDKPNKIWCTDITYLIYNGKRAYLSTILDLYDRKVIAYKISKYNNNHLVEKDSNKVLAIAVASYIHGIGSQPLVMAMRENKVDELLASLPGIEEIEDEEIKRLYTQAENCLISMLVRAYNKPEPNVPMEPEVMVEQVTDIVKMKEL